MPDEEMISVMIALYSIMYEINAAYMNGFHGDCKNRASLFGMPCHDVLFIRPRSHLNHPCRYRLDGYHSVLGYNDSLSRESVRKIECADIANGVS